MFRYLISTLILASASGEYIYIKSDAPLKNYYFKIRNKGDGENCLAVSTNPWITAHSHLHDNYCPDFYFIAEDGD